MLGTFLHSHFSQDDPLSPDVAYVYKTDRARYDVCQHSVKTWLELFDRPLHVSGLDATPRAKVGYLP